MGTTIMKKVILASVSLLTLAGTGWAAEVSMSSTKAPVMAAAAPAWAGLYLGIQGGLAQNYSTFNDLDFIWNGASNSIGRTGGVLGSNVGYNWQDRSFVWGFETDLNWVGAKATQTLNNGVNLGGVSNTLTSDIRWAGSFRGRVGLDVESTLIYVTGGLAFAGVNNTFLQIDPASGIIGSFTDENTKLGWTFGIGAEHMFAGQWIARGELRYTDLGNKTVNCPDAICDPSGLGNSFRGQFSNQLWTGTVGLGYKF